MVGDKPPAGQRFSLTYLQRGEPTRDSPRMRRRLYALFDSLYWHKSLAATIQRELGVQVPYGGEFTTSWDAFFGSAELRDVLDTITLAFRYFKTGPGQSLNQHLGWLQGVQRIFREENVGYTVDESGGVHFLVDSEFEHTRASAVAALGPQRYSAALASFEAAHRALDENPPDGKSSIRDTFEATETVFKLIFAGAARLGATEINQHLKPLLAKKYAGNEPAVNAANLFANSFLDWTNAAHQYRHGQGTEEPKPPPLDLAVAMVSSGASYLRWLAELDTALRA